MTVYGTYIIGRNWYFVLLDGREYAVSNAFNASEGDIFIIFQMIQKVKRFADVAVLA